MMRRLYIYGTMDRRTALQHCHFALLRGFHRARIAGCGQCMCFLNYAGFVWKLRVAFWCDGLVSWGFSGTCAVLYCYEKSLV